MPDIRRQFEVTVQGQKIKVFLDGASRASGRQRGYRKRLHPGLQPCFKYTGLRVRWSVHHAAAFLACWAAEPLARPAGWPRIEHRAFLPSEASVEEAV
eukprot:3592291-Alexandrium_andersonii.AAC.1